jgi:hypothetical protein
VMATMGTMESSTRVGLYVATLFSHFGIFLPQGGEIVRLGYPRFFYMV